MTVSERCRAAAYLLLVVGAIAGATGVRARSPVPILPAAEAALKHPGQGETRALLVAAAGKLSFEHYGAGFAAETRFVSWSMAKTVTALALGLLVDEGRIDIDAPAPVPAWRAARDGREAITTRQLLTMTSGLKHQEGSERGLPIERADTVRLLFSDGSQDAAGYAIAQPLAYPPGRHWQYSTASTHILAEIITNVVAPGQTADVRRRTMARWFSDRLWTPLGVTSAEWDFDRTGLFLGGSMLHMTAADYLRLGQLMLARGRDPDGRQVVSEQWIGQLLAKASADNNNHYAGQLWLNTGPAEAQQAVLFHPAGGVDTYALIGHLGQYVVIVPSRRMVIVRLGKSITAERAAVRAALGALIEAVPR